MPTPHLLRLTSLLFCLALAPLLHAAPASALPAPTEKRVYKEIAGTKLELWIWKPADWKAGDRRSGIVFFHGGGWRGGNPSAFSRQSAKLAERGMVAISVQYRLISQPGVTVPDCVKDARSAFRWVRARAAELGLDPEKLAAGGGSAGGHLAAGLVTLGALNEPGDDPAVSTRPAALVLFNPALKLAGLRAEPDARFADAAALAAIDPYGHVARGHPPTIILHGEDDTTVPIASVRTYARKVESLGGRCEVVGFPGQVHAFFNREPFVWETLAKGAAFLESVGLLTAPGGAKP
jgi:acetyl esterase/lipase